jgi:endoglucanase
MLNSQIKLLESLVKVPSPSGFEGKIAEFIKQEVLKYVPKTRVSIDRQNNVSVVIKGVSDRKVMIDAHSDQIGFIVTNIDRKGFISLQYIGGGDTTILTARDLVILTDKGKINAVINRRHSHLVSEDESDTFVSKMHQAAVDIGVRSKAKVQAVVKIGDPVIYKPSFNHLREGFYSGCGMDDKVGCFVLLETIKNIIKSKKKPPATLVFTFSAQEETGGRKCRPLIKRFKPDLFIEVDVTFATDWEDDDDLEREVGKCELTKGVVLYRGVDIDKDCFKLANSTARNHKIKKQIQASVGDVGYTATEVTHEGDGIKALIFGVPLRNMHTPVEIINTRDLNASIQLLTRVLLHRNIGRVLET